MLFVFGVSAGLAFAWLSVFWANILFLLIELYIILLIPPVIYTNLTNKLPYQDDLSSEANKMLKRYLWNFRVPFSCKANANVSIFAAYGFLGVFVYSLFNSSYYSAVFSIVFCSISVFVKNEFWPFGNMSEEREKIYQEVVSFIRKNRAI